MANSKFFRLPGLDVAIAVVPVDPTTGNPRLSRSPVDVMCGFVPGLVGLVVNAFRAGMPNGVSGVVEEITRSLVTSSAGLPMTIRSTSAADVGPVVRVGALGTAYAAMAPISVALNGTTPISLFGGAPLTRVNFLGRTSGDFVGNVLVENAGATYGFIAAGQQTMRSSLYTVPAGFRLFVCDLMASTTRDAGAGASCPVILQIKPVGSATWGSLFSFALRQDGVGAFSVPITYSQGLTGPVDLRVSGIASLANLDAQSLMSGILQDLSVT